MSKLIYDNEVLYFEIGKDYVFDVHAEVNYWYTPGTMYRSNGDPGDPPDEDLEIEKVEVTCYLLDENGERTKVDVTDHMMDSLYDYLHDMDIDEWKADETEVDE